MHKHSSHSIVIDTQKVQPGSAISLDNISLLARPEHHVRLPRDALRMNDKAGRGLFSILKFHIICNNYVCKEGLDFADREEPTWAERGIWVTAG